MGDHLVAATTGLQASPSMVVSPNRDGAGAPHSFSSSEGPTTREVTDADRDRLAAALARLLADWWRRQQEKEEAPRAGGAAGGR
jgi:hypothetical protein